MSTESQARTGRPRWPLCHATDDTMQVRCNAMPQGNERNVLLVASSAVSQFRPLPPVLGSSTGRSPLWWFTGNSNLRQLGTVLLRSEESTGRKDNQTRYYSLCKRGNAKEICSWHNKKQKEPGCRRKTMDKWNHGTLQRRKKYNSNF